MHGDVEGPVRGNLGREQHHALTQSLWDAVNRQDWNAALSLWETLPNGGAEVPENYIRGGLALRKLERFDEAELLFEDALARFPDFAQIYIDRAWLATERQDIVAASERWKVVCDVFPDDPRGYEGLGITFRRLNALPQADKAFEEGLARFPGNMFLLIGWSETAHMRRDWPEAIRRWEMARAFFPDVQDIYVRSISALREGGRLDEADAVFAPAAALRDPSPNLRAEHAWTAHVRGDWAEAARRWHVLRSEAPDRVEGYIAGASASRQADRADEAEAILTQGLQRFPDRADLLTTLAHAAQARGDFPTALRWWGVVKEKHSHLPEGYVGASQALRELGRVAEGDALLAPALRIFENNVSVLAEAGWNGNRMGDPDLAMCRWATVRARFPDHPSGYIGAAWACREAGRLAEAEAVLSEGMDRLRDDFLVVADHARLPALRHEFGESVKRWQDLHARFGRNAAAAEGLAGALRDDGRFDEAEAVAAEALEVFPANRELRMTLAKIATAREDHAGAIRRWAHLHSDFPANVAVCAGYATGLREAGRLDEAEVLIAGSLQLIPGDIELERQRAMTVSARRDWAVALPLWDALKRRAPGNRAVRDAIRNALWQARVDQGAETIGEDVDLIPSFEIPASLLIDDTDAKEEQALLALLLRFESLGHTCEFGILQRRFGAEPIGLLRWASITPKDLLVGLQSRFVGIGDVEQTEIHVIQGEYSVRDTRYGIRGHTFTRAVDVPPDRFYKQHCRRAKFLKRHLIEIIESGERILVYKFDDFGDDLLNLLYQAVTEYNPATMLLAVRLEKPGHPSGTIEQLASGLIAGYIDRFSNVDLSVDTWLSLCRQTLDIHKRTSEKSSMAA